MKTLGRLVLQGVILAALGIMPPPLSAAPGTGTLFGTDAFNPNVADRKASFCP